ncbi:MAG: IS1634 family transposase [Acholeplasmataceae bacterium]
MALYLKKTPQYGRVYLSIVDSVYDPKIKNVRQKTFKSLGYLDNLEKEYVDPIGYFQNWIKEENERRKNSVLDPIPTDKKKLIHLGYFPLKRLYNELQLKELVDATIYMSRKNARYSLSNVFELLVYSRALNPNSKLESYESMYNSLYHNYDFSKAQMYDAIEALGSNNADTAIFEYIRSEYGKRYRTNTKKVYFDCTNFFFEIDKPHDYMQKGPCKSNTNSPIIGLALLLDEDKIPIDYKIYPGNESEYPFYNEVIGQMKEKHNIKGKVIRIADKGLNSSENIAKTYLDGDGYIFSETVRGAKKEIKDWIIDPKGYEEILDKEGNLMAKYKSRVDYFDTLTVTNKDGKKVKVEIPQLQIAYWSRDYAQKTKYERDVALTKLEKKVETPSGYKRELFGHTSKFIKEISYDKDGQELKVDTERFIDYEKVDIDSELDGFNLFVTSEIKAPPLEVVDAYKALWQIEDSFRVLKTTLETRPVYHSKMESIRGHFLICMVTLFLLRVIEVKKLKKKISLTSLVNSLRKYQAVKISNNKYLLLYIDENLTLISQYYGIKLNQFTKNNEEIKKLF